VTGFVVREAGRRRGNRIVGTRFHNEIKWGSDGTKATAGLGPAWKDL
jgi:hypothetical protein